MKKYIRLNAETCTPVTLTLLSEGALRLYVLTAIYCTSWQLGLRFPRNLIGLMPPNGPGKRKALRLAAELEKAGLWVRDGDDWKITGSDHRGPFLDEGYRQTTWDKSAYEAVYERDGFECRYCGTDSDLSIDHVIPRRRGGTDHEANLVVACRSCNSRKSGRTPEQAGMTLRPIQERTDTGASNGPIESSASNEGSA